MEVPHLKAPRHGIYETRELSCGCTFSMCQGILKSGNLLNKRGYVKTQMLHTVSIVKCLKEKTYQGWWKHSSTECVKPQSQSNFI